ncbi:hypothetical protein BGW41_007275 [Actinomortierella wolfii]|nr:hypothetical protein BGW41_007275 [Actinomortierella wolfii]
MQPPCPPPFEVPELDSLPDLTGLNAKFEVDGRRSNVPDNYPYGAHFEDKDRCVHIDRDFHGVFYNVLYYYHDLKPCLHYDISIFKPFFNYKAPTNKPCSHYSISNVLFLHKKDVGDIYFNTEQFYDYTLPLAHAYRF